MDNFVTNNIDLWPIRFPWLRKLDEHGNFTGEYAPVWTVPQTAGETQGRSRKITFGSPAANEQVSVPALLWELQVEIENLNKTYNDAVTHHGQFEAYGKGAVKISVNVSQSQEEDIDETRDPVIPAPVTEVCIWPQDSSNFRNKEFAYRGHVHVDTDTAHFSIVANTGRVIVQMIKRLTAAEILDTKMVIITMYVHDKRETQHMLRKKRVSVEVCTVDSFQGHEREIVFVHFPANHEEGEYNFVHS